MKKGFTLIELLAVIVILAIIAVITVPKVSEMIDSSRKGGAEDSFYGIIKTAELAFSKGLKDNKNLGSSTCEIENQKLKCTGMIGNNTVTFSSALTGRIPESGLVILNENGSASVNVNNPLLINGYKCYGNSSKVICLKKEEEVKESRILKQYYWESNEDFHSDYYRENIASVTFLDTNALPSNAYESWDVSEKGDGGVMAYVIPTAEDNSKYDLYIGAKGGVVANEDSAYLFHRMFGVTYIEFNDNFDTSNVKNMQGMFRECQNLKRIDLSIFDTSNVNNMGNLFSNWNNDTASFRTSSLEKIIFGKNFDTSNVTNFDNMFSGCTELTSLNLSMFDTSKAIGMYHMFNYCTNLTELNLCSFNTKNVTSAEWMFRSTYNLKSVYVGDDFDLSGVSDAIDIFRVVIFLR